MGELMDRLSALFAPLAERLGASGASSLLRGNTLIIAIVVAGVLSIALLIAIALLPAKRKVVRRRRVRRIRREVAPDVPRTDGASANAAEPVSAAVAPTPPRGRRTLVTVAVWSLLGVLTLATSYLVTGSNQYCGQTCHAEDPRVVVAVENPHGDCVRCHESGPVTGIVSRFRMAYQQALTDGDAVAGVPIESGRCLECHSEVEDGTVTTTRGLIVSHQEILAGGRTCADCHEDAGHRKGRSFSAGMSSCTVCHDGEVAQRECGTCHSDGSPLSSTKAAHKASSRFDYPAVRVANRECGGCHGEQTECKSCHNGLVLPHPAAFVKGGHARTAAFEGKERCFKCHSIMWCGDSRCHQNFSAHDEKSWRLGHQRGTSEQCGSCHLSWSGKGSFCDVCH